MHHRIDIMGAHDSVNKLGVAGFTYHQLSEQNTRFESGREVIEHNNFLTLLAELFHCMAADVAGSACYEY